MSQRDWVVTAEIPVAPDSSLLPNRAYRRGGWHQRIESARELRTATWAAALRSAPPRPLIGPVFIEAVIQWPPRRKTVDFDAAVASLKPVLDGCTDAHWWVDDSQVVGMAVRQERGTGGITITAYIKHEGEEVISMPSKKMPPAFLEKSAPGKKEKTCPKCKKAMSKCMC